MYPIVIPSIKSLTLGTSVIPCGFFEHLLTLNQDGSFKESKNVTGIITKFEYCMHLTFLNEIQTCVSTQEINEVTACDTLECWFTEKAYFTFAHPCSLQHRASAISYDMAPLHIWWTDMESWMSLCYKGNYISFPNVCKIFVDTKEDLMSTWENKILRGLDLRVHYDKLADDLTNKNVPGYSFISNV